jgi:hypothetical protein
VKRLSLLLTLLAAVVAAVLGPAPCRAEGLEIEPVIGGRTMRCVDFRGQAVRTLRASQLGDVGRAWIVTRMPVIALDPDRLAALPETLQIFFYMHECAHHVLGHNFSPTPTSEPEADCWAVAQGRDARFFTREDVVAFAPFLARTRPSPFGHLPGPLREANLLKCFDDRSTAQAANE